jgi:GH24 family phage-related lysozyme (muramidase)
MTDQWSFTAVHEGVVPHLYLDTRGNPTCGVGFLVPDEATLVRLPWRPNVQAAITDYHNVRAAAPGHAASFYRQFCACRLTEPDMRRLFDEHVKVFRKALEPAWHLASCPEPVQVALVDMAFNLGVGGLAKYRKLQAAVFAKQWVAAASECSRGGIGAARNEATRQLFLSAQTAL